MQEIERRGRVCSRRRSNTRCGPWRTSPRSQGGARTVEQIAKATKVSPTYLAKVVQELVHGGVARSQRGIGGGITLAKSAEELTMLEVVKRRRSDPTHRDVPAGTRVARRPAVPAPQAARQRPGARRGRLPLDDARRDPRRAEREPTAVRLPLGGRATTARHCPGDRAGGLTRPLRRPALDERFDGRIMRVRPKWRNWQTRQLQELVLARVWRFESSLRHYRGATTYGESHGSLPEVFPGSSAILLHSRH